MIRIASIAVVLSISVASAHAQSRVPPASCLGQSVAAGVNTAVPRLRAGLDANPKASSNYRREDWGESIGLMKTTAANHFHYAKLWSEIERTAGTYDLDEVRYIVEHSAPLDVAFNLRIIDAGSRNMPDAYKGLAWDSPAMIGHVTGAVEALAPILGARPWSYAIGNEIDIYFSSRPGEVAAYARMLERVKARIRQLHPGACFTTSLQSFAAGQLRTLYAPITNLVDHVTLTYYPLADGFLVRPPSVAASDLQAMLELARPLPLFIQELGYPTAGLLGSSPERQAEFLRRAFEFLRSAPAGRILGATVLFQADLPGWVVDLIAQTYGAADSANFRAFVSTLGLRDDRDRPKPGWDEFERQVQLIGPAK